MQDKSNVKSKYEEDQPLNVELISNLGSFKIPSSDLEEIFTLTQKRTKSEEVDFL